MEVMVLHQKTSHIEHYTRATPFARYAVLPTTTVFTVLRLIPIRVAVQPLRHAEDEAVYEAHKMERHGKESDFYARSPLRCTAPPTSIKTAR